MELAEDPTDKRLWWCSSDGVDDDLDDDDDVDVDEDTADAPITAPVGDEGGGVTGLGSDGGIDDAGLSKWTQWKT